MKKVNYLSRYLAPAIFMLAGFTGGALFLSSNILVQEAQAPASPNAELVDQISRENEQIHARN